MSRFYNIVVSPETSAPISGGAPSNNAGAIWTNYVNGKADLGAQTVELDIVSTTIDQPVSAGSVKIWGISKAQLSQSSNFNGAQIQVFAGMQPGLPLATADFQNGQQGLIAQGVILQAFGNWQGVNQTLDFVIIPSQGNTQTNPGNISFIWKKGTPLSDAIRSILQIAYPTFDPPVINISPNLVRSQDEPFVWNSASQFGNFIKKISQDTIGGNYLGVSIVQDGNHFNVYDGTSPSQSSSAGSTSQNPSASNVVTAISIQDLIGQPTWLDINVIQFSTVLRADLVMGSLISFPPVSQLFAITNAQSNSFARDQNTFNGNWQINFIRHVGNSRAPDAQSWITTFQAVQFSTS